MVLRPVGDMTENRGEELLPAWDAIFPTQECRVQDYWLINQPDHAVLAGEFAALMGAEWLPRLDPDVVEGIRVHDAGWAIFAAERDRTAPPTLMPDGKPASFLDISPADFTRAWVASIDTAEQVAPIAGLIVSGHFWRLTRFRAQMKTDSSSDRAILADFLEAEESRKPRLLGQQKRSLEEVEKLVDVLQFCDLVSLYLCCGANRNVEFTQQFPAGRVRACRQGGDVCLTPSPFRSEIRAGSRLSIRAASYPRGKDETVFSFTVGGGG